MITHMHICAVISVICDMQWLFGLQTTVGFDHYHGTENPLSLFDEIYVMIHDGVSSCEENST